MKKNRIVSYTITGEEVYSDGWRRGRPRGKPDLAKCPNCGAIFFVHNLWAEKEITMEEGVLIKNIERPETGDYLKAIEQGLAKNRDEEIQIRKALWRSLNNEVRDGGNFTDEQMKTWEENNKALLTLVEVQYAEMQRAVENDDDVSVDEGDLINTFITIMELHRNLGLFEDAAGDLAQIPDERCWFRNCYGKKLKEKNCLPFELTGDEQEEE
jgi:Zn ribbon nucleic-acid-binding protein